eukprot:scaffold5296_cov28-Tisochrysis_lutea.AAC.1
MTSRHTIVPGICMCSWAKSHHTPSYLAGNSTIRCGLHHPVNIRIRHPYKRPSVATNFKVGCDGERAGVPLPLTFRAPPPLRSRFILFAWQLAAHCNLQLGCIVYASGININALPAELYSRIEAGVKHDFLRVLNEALGPGDYYNTRAPGRLREGVQISSYVSGD